MYAMSPLPAFTPGLPLAPPSTRLPSAPFPHSRRTRLPRNTARATISPPLAPIPTPNTTPNAAPLRSQPYELHTTADFDDLQRSATAVGRPLVVLFHAKHCRACKFVVPKFSKLAAAHRNVVLATVLYSEARELSMKLGVVQVPVLQVYQGKDGKVDEFACGIHTLDKMRYTVDTLDQGSRYRKAAGKET